MHNLISGRVQSGLKPRLLKTRLSHSTHAVSGELVAPSVGIETDCGGLLFGNTITFFFIVAVHLQIRFCGESAYE